MKFGFVYPGGSPLEALEAGVLAEQAGWDGFFMWEGIWGVDPWVTLGAIAGQTRRIRLGTMLTPVSRRRPWKLAGETATLDGLSGGRAILAVGLGAPDTGFADFGEQTDRKIRAELLDEGLEIIAGLWQGRPVSFRGKHYRVNKTKFPPGPASVQQPRIPVWVVGAWPRPKSMARAARWDGLLPTSIGADGQARQSNPEELSAALAWIAERRGGLQGFDVIVEGETPGDDPAAAAAILRPWQEAGATWWLEARWSAGGQEEVLERIREGHA